MGRRAVTARENAGAPRDKPLVWAYKTSKQTFDPIESGRPGRAAFFFP